MAAISLISWSSWKPERSHRPMAYRPFYQRTRSCFPRIHLFKKESCAVNTTSRVINLANQSSSRNRVKTALVWVMAILEVHFSATTCATTHTRAMTQLLTTSSTSKPALSKSTPTWRCNTKQDPTKTKTSECTKSKCNNRSKCCWDWKARTSSINNSLGTFTWISRRPRLMLLSTPIIWTRERNHSRATEGGRSR